MKFKKWVLHRLSTSATHCSAIGAPSTAAVWFPSLAAAQIPFAAARIPLAATEQFSSPRVPRIPFRAPSSVTGVYKSTVATAFASSTGAIASRSSPSFSDCYKGKSKLLVRINEGTLPYSRCHIQDFSLAAHAHTKNS